MNEVVKEADVVTEVCGLINSIIVHYYKGDELLLRSVQPSNLKVMSYEEAYKRAKAIHRTKYPGATCISFKSSQYHSLRATARYNLRLLRETTTHYTRYPINEGEVIRHRDDELFFSNGNGMHMNVSDGYIDATPLIMSFMLVSNIEEFTGSIIDRLDIQTYQPSEVKGLTNSFLGFVDLSICKDEDWVNFTTFTMENGEYKCGNLNKEPLTLEHSLEMKKGIKGAIRNYLIVNIKKTSELGTIFSDVFMNKDTVTMFLNYGMLQININKTKFLTISTKALNIPIIATIADGVLSNLASEVKVGYISKLMDVVKDSSVINPS